MPKTITQLTAASAAETNAVVAIDNAAGTLTEKVTLGAIASLAAPLTHGGQHARTGSDRIPVIISTLTALTQQANDYDLGANDVVYVSAATTTRDITGLTGGTTGSAVLVINSGTTDSVVVKHAHTSSSTANRVLVPWEGDYVLAAKGGAALLIYDTTESRWRVV